MFGRQFNLFKLFGFQVSLDASWIIIAVLVTWSLATGFFPTYYKGLSTTVYWYMGAIGAVGLFLSIIFHEFWHSLVARRFGLPMKGITLFLFGGVAQMSNEPENAKTEFFMAVAGPIASIFLGGVFYLGYLGGKSAAWPTAVQGVIGYLAFINWILAGFNLLPAFPLDGGRMLRSALWKWKGDLRWATRISSQVGSGFGVFLIVLGVMFFLLGDFIGGLWYFVIGLFLKSIAEMSYKQLLVRRNLEGEKVSDFMNKNPIAVSPSLPVKDLVEDYVYKYHFKMYPVVDGQRLAGCVTTRRVKDLAREQWSQRRVGDLVEGCSEGNTIGPDADVIKALQTMNRTGNSRLMVVDEGRLVGIIALKDILNFLNVRMDLEGFED